MAWWNRERFRLPATIAALAALATLAVAQLISSVPASAHVRVYHHHYLARREAAPAGKFAQPTWVGYQNPQSFNGSASPGESSPIDGMAASAAGAAGIPASLVERVIKRESGGNPRAVSKGNYGLMQIRLGTARAMGYAGSAEGLLDAQTNMTYAAKYLAGAYRAAGGNENRAVALYASGYYAQAKAQGFAPQDFPPQDFPPQDFASHETARTNTGFGGDRHVADAGWHFESPTQPSLYAYAPAYPLHYRVHHYRHHAV